MFKTVYARIGLSILACLCGLEVFFRVLGFASPVIYMRTEAGYQVRPNQHTRFLFKQINYNKEGMRSPEIAALPGKDTRRILFLGDSITYGGSQINDAQTYPLRFQALNRNTETLNVSAGGWSTFNEQAWLEAHGLYASNLLVLQIGENDLFQPFALSDTVGSNLNFPGQKPVLATTYLVERYVLPKLGVHKASSDPGTTASSVDLTVEGDVIKAVDQINTYARTHKANVAILYIDPKEPNQSKDFSRARDDLFAYAKTNKIPVIRPELNKAANAAALYRDPIHPNVAGNEQIALALTQALPQGPSLALETR